MLIYLPEAKANRGVAQPGSAPEWGSGGRRFESGHPDHKREVRWLDHLILQK